MDGTSSIIDQQRTYYFNGTYDEVLSNDQPKPPPMLPHGDDILAVPKRRRDDHSNRKWSERRKDHRDVNKKQKKMVTTGTESETFVTTKNVSTLSADSSDGMMVASLNNNNNINTNSDNSDAKQALPASEIPEGFPEELVFRALAAYATLRTLSVPLRLSPFTPIAFLRAIYLPYPNRLLGSVHVHILRILLHNLQMGYHWKDSATVAPPLDVVKKRRIDHIKWPLRAGDNLRYLDMHTWPIFYDDYCHLTADVIYASLYDILDHVDARTLHLQGIIDRFSTSLPETTVKPVPQYRGDTHPNDVEDVVIIDSDEDYKVEEEDDDDNDAFDYDDESYGQSKKKKKKGKTSKTKQRTSLPKSTSGHGSTKGTVKLDSTLPAKHQLLQKTHSFPQPTPAIGVPSSYPPHLATHYHQQRQQLLYDNEQHRRFHYPPTTHPYHFGRHDFAPKNVSPFHRPPVMGHGTNYRQHQQQVHRTAKQPDYQSVPNPLSQRPVGLEPIRGTMSLDRTASYQPDRNSTSVKQPQLDGIQFKVMKDNDSAGNQRDIIVIDSPNSSSEDHTIKSAADDDMALAARSRRMKKSPKARSFVGSKELLFFQERYGLQNPPNVPDIFVTATGDSDDRQFPTKKRSRDEESDARFQAVNDAIRSRVQKSFSKHNMDTYKDPASNAGVGNPSSSLHTNGFDLSRPLAVSSSIKPSTNAVLYHHAHSEKANDTTHYHQSPKYHDRPIHHEYGSYPSHPTHRSADDCTTDAPDPPKYNNYVPFQASPIWRTNSSIDNCDAEHDASASTLPVELPERPKPHQTGMVILPTEGGVVAMSNVATVPSLPNNSKVGEHCRVVALQRTIESSIDVPIHVSKIKVPQPNTDAINPRTSQNVKPTAIKNARDLTTESFKAKLQSDSSSDTSSDAVSRLQAFLRGHHKSINPTCISTSDDQAISNDNISDSVTFPIDEPENWSHFAPIKAMRLGTPYHTLSVGDKLTILEFLIDELLSVEWVANEFTLRHDSNTPHELPYGLKPSDAEMLAVKEADGDQHDELCKVCGEIGDVVCCDGCLAVYHGECAGFLNASRLPDIWYCPECIVKDPSSFGPLRSLKKSEVDWFTIADINAADVVGRDQGSDDLKDFNKHAGKSTAKFLAVHGFVFCQNKDFNGRTSITDIKPSIQKVLAPRELVDVLKSFGQVLYSKWPIEQIPTSSKALWKSESDAEYSYFKRKECFDPTLYENKYYRAPILLDGIRRSKESYLFEEKILNDSSVTSGVVDILTCDVSNDSAVSDSILSNPMKFDALQVIKSCLLKIENDLSKAFLLDEFWDDSEMAHKTCKTLSWKESVKHCSTVRCLSRLLLQLVDATHHRAFVESWTQSLVAKSKEGMTIRNADSGLTGFSPQEEALHRYWVRSRICHLPTLLLKTSKYLISIGQKSGAATSIDANSSKRKGGIRKSKQDENNSHVKHLENFTATTIPGDSETKLRNRREYDSINTDSSFSNLKVDSRLEGFIRRRTDTFIRESKQSIHREIHWPVAGKKLFDPTGYLPTHAVRYLGRNGGAHFAPFVDYSTLHEVGQVAYCHVWRKRVLLCSQFEYLLELVRILVMHMNNPTISTCALFANSAKATKGKNSITIHGTQRDLLTGVDYHLVGMGQPVTKTRRWESSIEIDLSVFVQERIRRRKLHIDTAANKKRIQVEAMKPRQAVVSRPKNKPSSEDKTGTNVSAHNGTALPDDIASGYQNATILAAKIVAAHIEETKKLILRHGDGLRTEHMIAMRKKTDEELSRVLVGNLSYVIENGRIEMMMKAEESARESMNQDRLPLSNTSNAILMPDSRQTLQASLSEGQVANNTVNTPSIDMNEIMKSGSPFDWSKQVVQQHKNLTRLLCQKYGDSPIPDAELEGSRRQCISNLHTIFKKACLQHDYNQISAVIKEAENEARADFLVSSKKSTVPLPSAASFYNNPSNVLELQNLKTGSNVNNPFVESGAVHGGKSNFMYQSQNSFQTPAAIPTTSANVMPNATLQAPNSNYWHTQQPPNNVNPTFQPWQMANNGAATSHVGAYSSHPQQMAQSSSVPPYHMNLSAPGNNAAYASHQLQQQQWLSSQQQPAVSVSANLYGHQNQALHQSFNTGTPWSSMPSSMNAHHVQPPYPPQQENQQWSGDAMMWSQQQQQQHRQYQQQDDKSINSNWYANSSQGR